MGISVGVDLVAVDSVVDALRSPNGSRYLARVYTEREVTECQGSSGVDPARLAARFAAKEATLKAISVGNDAVALRDIEVWTEGSGRVRVALRGRAAEIAAEAGVTDLAVSLSHEVSFAAAVVVAHAKAAT